MRIINDFVKQKNLRNEIVFKDFGESGKDTRTVSEIKWIIVNGEKKGENNPDHKNNDGETLKS
jgi:hypothetical protein